MADYTPDPEEVRVIYKARPSNPCPKEHWCMLPEGHEGLCQW
jgi:hypothetical protein